VEISEADHESCGRPLSHTHCIRTCDQNRPRIGERQTTVDGGTWTGTVKGQRPEIDDLIEEGMARTTAALLYRGVKAGARNSGGGWRQSEAAVRAQKLNPLVQSVMVCWRAVSRRGNGL